MGGVCGDVRVGVRGGAERVLRMCVCVWIDGVGEDVFIIEWGW